MILYPTGYSTRSILLRKLKNLRAKAKILFRIQKLETDEHFGDSKSVGNGISELRINYAKGCRVYFKDTEGKIIILLIGGDRSTQQKDIKKAEETGMSRASLYKELSDGAKPQFTTIMKVLKAVGGQIRVNPISA